VAADFIGKRKGWLDRVKDKPPGAAESAVEATAAPDPKVCPECGGKGTVYKTEGRIQYRKCADCGDTYKTVRQPNRL